MWEIFGIDRVQLCTLWARCLSLKPAESRSSLVEPPQRATECGHREAGDSEMWAVLSISPKKSLISKLTELTARGVETNDRIRMKLGKRKIEFLKVSEKNKS